MSICLVGGVGVFFSQHRANQSKLYHECVQDWLEKGVTPEEASLECDILLE